MRYLILILALYGCGNTDEYCTRKDFKGGCVGNVGPKGSPGPAALIKTKRYDRDLGLCPSNKGVLMQIGVDRDNNGQLDFQELTDITVVCDGVDGTPGSAGPQGSPGPQGAAGKDAVQSQYNISSIYDPCGTQSAHDEVILRTQNNGLLAIFASGGYDYMTNLTPGNYTTTDGTNCFFTVNNDMSISNEHN
jgi:hypothetical protein